MSFTKVFVKEYGSVGFISSISIPFSYKKYISIVLSLAPGVHDNTTVPEQVRELKVAVKEVGGEGGSRKNRCKQYYHCITIYVY